MSQIAPAPPNPTFQHGRRPPFASSPPPSMWPDARVEALKRAWSEGLSASQIADRLGGGLTRSAVIGKLHRLGLCGGRKPSAPRAPAAPSLRMKPGPELLKPTLPGPTSPGPMSPRPTSLRIVWPERVQDPAPLKAPVGAGSGSPPSRPGAKYLRDMGPRECRFGLGDPGVGNGAFQLFCAAPTQGHAYCAHHRAIAVLPPQSLSEQKVINAELEAVIGGVKRQAVRRHTGIAP